MSVENITGILVILAAYGLTWYLLLKSMKIVNRIARGDTKAASGAEPTPRHEDTHGSDK